MDCERSRQLQAGALLVVLSCGIRMQWSVRLQHAVSFTPSQLCSVKTVVSGLLFAADFPLFPVISGQDDARCLTVPVVKKIGTHSATEQYDYTIASIYSGGNGFLCVKNILLRNSRLSQHDPLAGVIFCVTKNEA